MDRSEGAEELIMLRRFRFAFLVGVGLVAWGCSLVNSVDDVKPADDGTFSGVPRPDASVAFDEAATQDGADAEAGSSTGTAHAILVVGGEAAAGDAGSRAPVLTVLDPMTGEEIAQRETMWVAGVGHDPQRDLWYIFEAPSYVVAAPTDQVKLHIRSIDAVTGKWTELSTLTVPPLTYYDAIAVTTQRLSFIAQTAGSSVVRLVTIDTSNPAAPTQIDAQDLPAVPRGIIATASSTGPGGRISLVNVSSNDDAGGVCNTYPVTGGRPYTVCTTTIRHYQIPNGGIPRLLDRQDILPDQVSSLAEPAYGSVICGGGPDNLVVLPGAGPSTGKEGVYTLDYATTVQTNALSFDMSTAVGSPTLLRKAAIDQARRLVFVVETNSDTNLYAIALDSDPAAPDVEKEPLRHSGQSVYYDPASETVFAPFNQGDGYTFSPFQVSGDNTLKERVSGASGDWNPPADLRPFILGIRDPASENCP